MQLKLAELMEGTDREYGTLDDIKEIIKSVNQTIINELRKIEKRENVTILLAVESGSRAWGFASPDSDYDVRFIYKRPLEEYLRLEKRRDVIELPIDDVLDINGWDLSKTLQLLHNSNPTLFEWFSSPIRYIDTDIRMRFDDLKKTYFLSKSGVYHYLSMAKGNFREYLKGDMVKAKKYFYVVRPILACRWILEKGTPPPMLFAELANSQLPAAMKPIIDDLLNIKINSPEIQIIPRIDVLNVYIENSIAEIEEAVAALPHEDKAGWDELNGFFRREVIGFQRQFTIEKRK